MTALGVVVDDAPLPDEEARAFWKRFSEWMEDNPGDLAGFAGSEGLASVHPEMHGGGPVLVASRSATQRPYDTAPKRTEAAKGGARDGAGKAAVGSRPEKRKGQERRK